MRAYERFLEYVKVYTTSDPENYGVSPSTQRQFDLANKLVDELKEIGVQNAFVDDNCYVYAHIPATEGCEQAPSIGLIAHLDTSPDAPGENVKPIMHPDYNGEDVCLPSGHVIEVSRFPALAEMKHETLITASGDTLLGADDKAGIAEIMTVCEELMKGEKRHGSVHVAFTPDEEIGAGAAWFDVKGFGAKFAYTADGGDVGSIDYETFNAAMAKVVFKGVEVHPGEAKGIMLNAATLAMEFDGLLPEKERPQFTEGREGFFHLHSLRGEVGKASAEYLIRDHDRDLFEKRKEQVVAAAHSLQQKYGENSVEWEITDNYANMGEVVQQHFHLVEIAKQAIEDVGLTPVTTATRGGTDGSALSFKGLPCPNLGTGGFYYHGPNECITVERMDRAVEILCRILELYGKQKMN